MTPPTGESPAQGPVKLFEFLKHPPGQSAAAFRAGWAERRLELFAGDPAVSSHILRHELYTRVDGDESRSRSEVEVPDTGFDAVAVTWFGSPADYEALRAEPTYPALAKALADQQDPEVASVLTGAPDIIVGPPGGAPGAGLSLLCILTHKPGLDLGEFHRHWLEHHGGLFQTIPELHDPLRGYEQNHGLAQPGAPYDGVTQQWFDSLESWTASLEVSAHRDVVNPDVETFLDLTDIHFVLAGPPRIVEP